MSIRLDWTGLCICVQFCRRWLDLASLGLCWSSFSASSNQMVGWLAGLAWPGNHRRSFVAGVVLDLISPVAFCKCSPVARQVAPRLACRPSGWLATKAMADGHLEQRTKTQQQQQQHTQTGRQAGQLIDDGYISTFRRLLFLAVLLQSSLASFGLVQSCNNNNIDDDDDDDTTLTDQSARPASGSI